jgi:hypothetical protein
MPQYKQQASTRVAHLDLAGAAHEQLAQTVNERADNFMLAVVRFASALFFAGISTKLDIRGMRASLIALGWPI